MNTMRAKLQVGSVFQHKDAEQNVTGESVTFFGVCRTNGYADTDGLDEDNTFARYTPSANFQIMIANPALFGQFEPGQKFYVDFSPAK
ncbi:hypothetical protein [Novosphingobium sp. SG707]|uniref:hypothetical protein n=1 Tax=Novosphingobium sp. SG707 TaxID=2586996 RepID=UPI00178FBE59|nr:hypothetical protein [Novosphingobium sp. SG707]NKI99569.1 hypothetical protein [Novosphingobium sp. SG707]